MAARAQARFGRLRHAFVEQVAAQARAGAQFAHIVGVASLRQVDLRQVEVRRAEVRIAARHGRQYGFGLGGTAVVIEDDAAVGLDGLGRRVERQGLVHVRQRFGFAAQRMQEGAVPVLDRRIAGFQRDGAGEFAVGRLAVPVAVKQAEGQGGVGASVAFVERDGLLRGGFGQRIGLAARHDRIFG